MSFRRRLKRKSMAEINVVPYIDVMLVLLVIFMITAPLLSQGIKVDLPKANGQVINTTTAEPIVVSVDINGKYYLNVSATPEQPFTLQTITARVAALLALASDAGQQREVYVKGDQHVPYGEVVQAMVALQSAGAKNVGLITESADKQVENSDMSS